MKQAGNQTQLKTIKKFLRIRTGNKTRQDKQDQTVTKKKGKKTIRWRKKTNLTQGGERKVWEY